MDLTLVAFCLFLQKAITIFNNVFFVILYGVLVLGNQGNIGSSINSIPDILNQYDRKRLKRKYRNTRESYQEKRRRPKRDSGEECKTYYETSCTTRNVKQSFSKKYISEAIASK